MPSAMQQMVRKLRVQSLTFESDRALLQAFADDADESAFAEIVRRHGPLVLGVCKRTLGNVQDAEDAFQATFLVLARKAASVPWRESIKNWLHGVAFRISMKARSRALRRKEKEKKAAVTPVGPAPAEAWNELRSVLDEEIARLPAKYRDVLILCYLEGKTRDEAADALGWSAGSVKGCLERGRDLLRDRLSKRGLVLAAVLSAGLLSEATATAAIVPAALEASAIQGAIQFTAGSASAAGLAPSVIHLAQGALNAMLIAKIKTLGLVTLVLMIGVGSGVGLYQATEGNAAVAHAARNLDLAPVAFAQEREGKKDEAKKKPDFLGLVKSVDLKTGTITVTSLRDGEGGADSTFSFAAKDLKVTSTFDQALKMSDLTPGIRVQLELKDQDVLAVRVEHPQVPAFLTHIDVEKRTIEGRAERKIAQYEVAKDAKITVQGQAVTLKDVPLEQRIFLTLSLDRKVVLAMNVNNKGERPGVERPKEGERPGAEKPKDGDRRPERPVERPVGLTSTIIDVDAARSSVNLLLGRGDELALQTMAVAKDLKVKVMFEEKVLQEIGLAQLTKPMHATMQLSEDKKTIVALTVQAPVVRCALKAIDTDAKKITVLTGERTEKTYDLDPEATVRVGGREPGRLADLKPGTPLMLGLSLDRQRVIGITVLQPVRRDGDR